MFCPRGAGREDRCTIVPRPRWLIVTLSLPPLSRWPIYPIRRILLAPVFLSSYVLIFIHPHIVLAPVAPSPIAYCDYVRPSISLSPAAEKPRTPHTIFVANLRRTDANPNLPHEWHQNIAKCLLPTPFPRAQGRHSAMKTRRFHVI